MSLKFVLEAIELLDSSAVSAADVAAAIEAEGPAEIAAHRIQGEENATEVITVRIPGSDPEAPTLGIVGMLGGVGARPARTGLVSDADGAIAVVAAAMKLARMAARGDRLAASVLLTTHICPTAPTRPHHPVPFMSCPVDRDTLLRALVTPEMDAILSIDTSRGNRLVSHNGIAITPTVMDGWILRVSEPLLDLLEFVTGEPARVMPITTQDVTPYANGLFHLNSMMQPSTIARGPTVGIAVTAATAVPGCATGATQAASLDAAVRLAIEVAKALPSTPDLFLEAAEFAALTRLYGSFGLLRTVPRPD